MPTIEDERCYTQRYDWTDRRQKTSLYRWHDLPRMDVRKRYDHARKYIALNPRHRGQKSAADSEALVLWRRSEILRPRFVALAEQWRRETRFSSSSDEKILNSAYQSIIAMGKGAIPLVLEELEARRGHWFWALRFMTGVDLLPEDANIEEARRAWLEWGKGKGLLKLNGLDSGS